MKCPKCGSELIKRCDISNKQGFIVSTDYWCENCEIIEFNHDITKQRLDRVLSKFEKNRNPKSNEYYYNCEYGLLIAIDIDREEKFSLYNNGFPVYISLDTVESLLKDLGVLTDDE